jgi:AcrR family transcriptional regulator
MAVATLSPRRAAASAAKPAGKAAGKRTARKAPVKSAAAPTRQVRRTQAERREEARHKLLDAALDIVARTGTVRLTLAEVGEAAGYSRGLPAHRFGSKAGLLRALAAHINARFQEQLRAAPPRSDGLDAIRGNISVYFSRTDRHWTTTRALLVMMTEGIMEGATLKADMAAYNRAALAFFEAQIRIGVEQGEIRADTDPATTAVLLLGALRGVMLQWLLDRRVDLLEVRDRLLDIVDRALARA